MKKRLLTFFVAASIFAGANAQQAYHRCSSMEYLEAQKLADPSLITRLQEIEEHTQQYAQSNGGTERAVIAIPVVFHVLYSTSAQNISDALINAQIAQLNADYARLNSDAGSTPSAFAGLGANTNIQFCLAKRDPSGNATTGIVRKSTTVTSWSTNDAVKKSSSGGDDAWPASSYLNIWVCNLGSGLLGYAQFPGGAAATDGVVLLYSSVGSLTTPGTASPYNYGRTATHEVGHWLNLYHIWGDDGTGCTGSDNVSDTPNQADENYGCPAFPTVSCSNGPNGDMYMNYMDYTDDGCMNLFTQGQSTRMNALFGTGGSRVGLLSSLGCQAPSGGGTTCAVATGLTTSSITTSSATIGWTAVSGAVSYNVQFRAVGGSTWTSGNVSSTSASLTGLSAATNYEWQVQTVCSSGSSAFSSSATFTTLSSSTCTDNYESNNTSSAAKTAPLNSNFNGLITPSTDVDWFKIVTTSSATRVKVDLTTLPADYDMVLYKSNGSTKLATSANVGTTSETLKYNATTAGTYYLKVYGYNGATSATSCYTLKVSTSASNFRTDGSSDGAIEAMEVTAEPALKLFPNPASDKLNAEFVSNTAGAVTFTVYNLSGQRVLTTVSEATEGYNTQSINTSTLSNGVYVLEINTNGETQRQKFTIGK